MQNINVVAITGNLTKDPELRHTGGGTAVCEMRVAVNSRRKDGQTGEWVDKPNYFDVKVWGARGESCAKHLAKGRPVAVEGRLDWRELDYAYALTNYGAQGKTFDRAYPFLDAGGDLEQQLVALSRGREIANVYVVASTELLDPDLGPGLREISDTLHDVRVAIEREGNDYTAAEVSLRKQIEQLAPSELAARRVELAQAGRAADPVLHRRDQLDREIKDAGDRVEWLRREREAVEAMREPPAEELARVTTGEANQSERLQRCIAERDALPESTVTAEPKPSDPSCRLEAVLVNADPDKALAWGRGAHEISTYRRRHGITDKADPLGRQPKGAAARAERARAQRRIAEAQRRLGRATDRSAQRSASRGISIGIGR